LGDPTDPSATPDWSVAAFFGAKSKLFLSGGGFLLAGALNSCIPRQCHGTALAMCSGSSDVGQGGKSLKKNAKKGGQKGQAFSAMEQLSSKKLDKFAEEQKRRGVIYLSRIPPYMKPEKIRSLLGSSF
jgi:hypothetical protein